MPAPRACLFYKIILHFEKFAYVFIHLNVKMRVLSFLRLVPRSLLDHRSLGEGGGVVVRQESLFIMGRFPVSLIAAC